MIPSLSDISYFYFRPSSNRYCSTTKAHKILISSSFSVFPITSFKGKKERNTVNKKIQGLPRCIFFFKHIKRIQNGKKIKIQLSRWSRCIGGNSRSSSKWIGLPGNNISWPDSLNHKNLAEGRSNIPRYLANPGFLR